jgi:threonine dehydratase
MTSTGNPMSEENSSLVSLVDIRAAAGALKGVAIRTPILYDQILSEKLGSPVCYKAESLQRAGAFKFRGAYNALAQLAPEQQRRGVLTFSSGNHAQAVAVAGRLLGIPATIIMPADAPAVKLAATRGYGAEVILYDRATTTREELGKQIAEERGLPLIPPYDHPDVVAGQGTAAKELIEAVPALDLLLVCCGGGGLLSGSAIAAKTLAPGCRVVGVEPARADDATRSFHTGTLQTVHNPDTIADGARTPSLGQITFPLVMHYVDDMVTVSEDAILQAMHLLWERMKLVVEPTGALAAAALLDGAVTPSAGSRIGLIISGGNVDLQYAARLFERLT